MLAFRRRQPRDQIFMSRSGRRATCSALAPSWIASRNRRQRIDRAALDAGAGNDGFSPHGVRAQRQRYALERLTFKAVAKNVGPGDGESAIGRSQRRYARLSRSASTQAPSEPSRGQLPPPSASTVALHSTARCPSGVSKRRRRSRPIRSSDAQRELHAHRIQPPQPARSSGDALNAFGNTRPLEPTKVCWPSASLQSRSASAETPR